MQIEFNVLTKNNTWNLMPMTPAYKLVGCKWVCRTKYNTDGTLSKQKAKFIWMPKAFTRQQRLIT